MPEPPGKTYQIRARHRLSIVDFGILTIQDGKAALWPAPRYSQETKMWLIQAKRRMNVSTCNFAYVFSASIAPKPEHLYVFLICWS